LKILLTGSSGFLGKVFFNLLTKENDVHSIGRNELATHNVDLLDKFTLPESYDCVIHAAGKAHLVPKSKKDVKAFWDVNVIGTRNLLNALEAQPPKYFVLISSVAVYGKTSGVLLDEQNTLSAQDPYGKSKIEAEQIVKKWCIEKNIISTILRLPLVAGENPPGNLGAMIQGVKKGYYFNTAGGHAKKSMVLALDIAKFILKAAEVGGTYNLSDGSHPNFNELSHCIAKQINRNYIPNMPILIARILAFIGDMVGNKFPINSNKLNKITSTLTFDDSKARKAFGWDPTPVLKGFKIHE
jgi:nucleoside-diphosphate-sugar epimerase